MEDIAALRHFITGLSPSLPEAVLQPFLDIWTPVAFKRKTLLTPAGTTERYLYFVLEGVQRAFYLAEERREATIVFTYPPSFSGVADSFLTRQPSRFYLETLTASRMLRTSYEQLSALMDHYPAIRELILQLVSVVLSGVLERQVELQCFSAEQKFRSLLQRSPHVLQLIPHKYLSSYLGIDPATFSKLLGSIKL